MNRDAVIAVLDQVLDVEGEVFKAALQNYPDASGEHAERLRLHLLGEHVSTVLEAQEEFKDKMVQVDSGYVGFQAMVAAPLLVKRARHLGSSVAAVDWLEMVLGTTEATGLRIMALYGLGTVGQRTQLFDAVSLWPFRDLPPSGQKRQLLEHPNPMSSQVFFPPPFMWKAPTAALVCRTTIKPFLVSIGEDGSPPKQQDRLGRDLIDEIRYCLACVGPCTPIAAASWFQFEDEAVEAARSGGGTHHRFMEVMPRSLKEQDSFDSVAASTVVKAYFKLSPKLRRRARTALTRLHQAMCRRDSGDAAVDLAICLETLLLVDDRGGSTHKLGLRAALLLGGDSETRLKNRSIVRAMYRLRGDLLHVGEIKPTAHLKGSNETVDAKVVVDRCAEICAAVVRNVLNRGGVPDWYGFELSPDA